MFDLAISPRTTDAAALDRELKAAGLEVFVMLAERGLWLSLQYDRRKLSPNASVLWDDIDIRFHEDPAFQSELTRVLHADGRVFVRAGDESAVAR